MKKALLVLALLVSSAQAAYITAGSGTESYGKIGYGINMGNQVMSFPYAYMDDGIMRFTVGANKIANNDSVLLNLGICIKEFDAEANISFYDYTHFSVRKNVNLGLGLKPYVGISFLGAEKSLIDCGINIDLK